MAAAALGLSISIAGLVTNTPASAQTDSPATVNVGVGPHLEIGTSTTSIIAEVNRYRRYYGLPAVMVSNALTAATWYHCTDMIKMNRLTHTGSDGSNAGIRITRAGFPWTSYGENLAVGQPTVYAVVRAWYDSAGHRANMLNRVFTYAGAYMIAGRGTYWWCLVLASR